MVANSERIKISGQSKDVPLWLGTHLFRVHLFILPLSGFDVVLGVNWLKNVGPILWDFFAMRMSFTAHGRQVKLQGIKIPKQPSLHTLTTEEDHGQEIQRLLCDFSLIFQESKGLPPSQRCDHKIILEPT